MVTANFHYVNDNENLAVWCQTFNHKPWIALDTEFARFKTYYQIVGLVQLSDGESHVLIDPMDIDAWQPLIDLLSNPSVTKVLHASGEDLELLQHWLDVVPTPLFDTQVAAAFAGLGISVGLQALVKQLLGIYMNKEEARSDWLQRPLTDAQLRYAALDVAYLLDCRQHLAQALETANKTEWFHQDMQQLAQKKQPILPEQAYLKVKGAWQLKKEPLQRLQTLARWRECIARVDNIPKGFILKDAQLMQLANRSTISKACLRTMEGIHPRVIRQYADDIVALFAAPPDNPAVTPMIDPISPITKQEQPQFKRLQAVVREVAQANQIAPQILAPKAQLIEIYHHAKQGLGEPNFPYFEGWRRDILAQPMAQTLSDIHHAR